MKTQIKKTSDSIIVSMDGRLDFETSVPLRDQLERLAREVKTDSVPKKIIFNLENLEFVGSSGISSFVQALREFNVSAPARPIYCNVKSEFRRVMKAFDSDDLFDFDESDSRAGGRAKKHYDN
jgi:anti-anti-sigma factor